MMKFRSIYLYLIAIAWFILLAIMLKSGLNNTGMGIILAILTFILTPGFLILSLLPLKNVDDMVVKICYAIGLGFGYYFLIGLFGILLGLTLDQLKMISFLVLPLLFLASLYLNWRYVPEINFGKIKKLTLSDAILLVTIIVGLVLTFLSVDGQSDKLIGDGYFHLGIIQKIISGVALDPVNFFPTKTGTINPVYSFPLWNITLSQFADWLGITPFTALRQAMLPLSLLALVAWAGFLKTFFKSKELVAFIFLAFLLSLLISGASVPLVALGSPDSFCRYLLLPLLFTFTARYFYFQDSSLVLSASFISIFAVFTGLIHFTELIGFLLVLGMYLIVLLTFDREKLILKKYGVLVIALSVLILPYLLVFQLTNIRELIMANISNYQAALAIVSSNAKRGINVLHFYPLLVLPVFLLFAGKQRQLFFLFSIAAALFLVSWPTFGLRNLFLKYLGEIFTSRAISDIPGWVFWGFGFCLIVVGINYLLSKLGKIAFLITNFLLGIFLVFTFISSDLRSMIEYFSKEIIFNSKNTLNDLLAANFWLLLALPVVLTVILFYLKPNLPEPKDRLNFTILTVILMAMLSTPFLGNYFKVRAENPNGNILSNRESVYASDLNRIGGEKTVEFFRSVPQGSVFLTDNVSLAQLILLYSPSYIAEYPYSITKFSTSLIFYNKILSSEERLAILDQLNVDYVIFRHAEEETLATLMPEKFELRYVSESVYNGKNVYFAIYSYQK